MGGSRKEVERRKGRGRSRVSVGRRKNEGCEKYRIQSHSGGSALSYTKNNVRHIPRMIKDLCGSGLLLVSRDVGNPAHITTRDPRGTSLPVRVPILFYGNPRYITGVILAKGGEWSALSRQTGVPAEDCFLLSLLITVPCLHPH